MFTNDFASAYLPVHGEMLTVVSIVMDDQSEMLESHLPILSGEEVAYLKNICTDAVQPILPNAVIDLLPLFIATIL
jgi:hypothetical protein